MAETRNLLLGNGKTLSLVSLAALAGFMALTLVGWSAYVAAAPPKWEIIRFLWKSFSNVFALSATRYGAYHVSGSPGI